MKTTRYRKWLYVDGFKIYLGSYKTKAEADMIEASALKIKEALQREFMIIAANR
jgi:hypothetical protein